MTHSNRAKEILIHAHKMKALIHMAGKIAHEIRNPLAISSSAAQLLMDDDISHHWRKECAQKIVAGINRASVIIENLLTFARPPVEVDMTEVNLSQVVRNTLSLADSEVKDRNVELIFRCDGDSLLVKGHNEFLQQAFLNLITNALAAMPDGGILRVSVQREECEAVATVSDTGHGIATKDLQGIFDPFFSASPVRKGAGLGLSVAYSIVKQLSGDIQVVSNEGKGTTFTVRLPLVEEFKPLRSLNL